MRGKTNPENESVEKAFYQELDEKTRHRSCCTGWTMIILFTLIALIVAGFTFYLVNKIKTISLPTKAVVENFSNKFQLNPQTNPTFSIIISAEDLNSMAEGIPSAGTFQVQNLTFSINELGIETIGELVKLKLVKFHLKMTSIPEISDGKLKLKVQRASFGGLNLPGFLRGQIEKSLNNLLDENFASLYENYQAEKIELKNNEMIINGRLK